jgi:signal transduction histidine kinase
MKDLLSNDLTFMAIAWIFFLLLIFLVVITLASRYRKRKKENLELKAQFEQALLKSKLEIQEQTLQHISREIHDNLGQVASLIKINLNTLPLDENSKANEKIEDTRELVRQLIADLKQLSGTLNSDKVLKNGLLKGLEFESARLNKTGVFESVFSLHDVIPDIGKDKAVILYRMSQEILNNSMKHSGAKHINIDVYYSENTLTILFKDDGRGFNPHEILKEDKLGGNGLGNLVNRAKLINAEISFDSNPQEGTKVTIKMIT